MTEPHDRQAIALFRYGLIADLIHLSAGSRGLYARLREKAAADYAIPGSNRMRVAQFIEAAAADLAVFLRGLALLPLRPGALAALKAGDFDRRLKVLRIGLDKQGKDRRIKLPDVTAELFDEASAGKIADAPLLSRINGTAWNKDAWKWPVKSAAQAAGLPEGATAYTMRHSVISDLVHDGLDLLTVAQISGTSVAMIERHYGHLRSDVAAGALARLALPAVPRVHSDDVANPRAHERGLDRGDVRNGQRLSAEGHSSSNS